MISKGNQQITKHSTTIPSILAILSSRPKEVVRDDATDEALFDDVMVLTSVRWACPLAIV